MPVCVGVHVRVRMRVLVCACTSACTCTCVYVCALICVYLCVSVFVRACASNDGDFRLSSVPAPVVRPPCVCRDASLLFVPLFVVKLPWICC